MSPRRSTITRSRYVEFYMHCIDIA